MSVYDCDMFEKDMKKHFPELRRDVLLSSFPTSSPRNITRIANFCNYQKLSYDKNTRTKYKDLAEYMIEHKHLYEWWKL